MVQTNIHKSYINKLYTYVITNTTRFTINKAFTYKIIINRNDGIFSFI